MMGTTVIEGKISLSHRSREQLVAIVAQIRIFSPLALNRRWPSVDHRFPSFMEM
jgi:hypothetical protein